MGNDVYPRFNLQGRVTIQHASGCAGGEINDDQADTVFWRTARPAVGNVCDTMILIDNDIIKETCLTIGHAVQGDTFNRSARVEIQYDQFLRA
ncbi:Uncharacterised protein [Enterobacter kobei]|nr:Uncharacterised protein [Enterobacter kobei]